MGILRFLLAMGVVFHHTPGGYSAMNGGLAVELFFIISGYYMAVVLEKKYAGQTFLFYSNRLLRLAPAYFAVMILQLILSFGIQEKINGIDTDYFLKMPMQEHLIIIGANAIVLGQEWLSFLTIDNKLGIQWDPDQATSGLAGWRLLVVPQAWSISLEIMFYALAPFVARRYSWIVWLLLLSWLAHKAALFGDLSYNSWGRRFFPFVLHFFLLGMLAHGISVKYRKNIQKLKQWQAHLLMLPLFAMLVVTRIPTEINYRFFYPCISIYVAAMVPILFAVCKSKIDTYLGELSYPIYISHFLVIGCMADWLLDMARWQRVALVGCAVILLSHLIYHLIDRNIDKLRQSRVARVG